MGDIGPAQQRYDVLPTEPLTVEDADALTVPARSTVPSPEPGPMPRPEPTPDPEPRPDPGPDPTPLPRET